jgi:hypothetical protein
MVCRMPHSPARWLPYGRPETSRLLEVDHYMLRVRIRMRSGGCAACSQNTDTDRGVGGWQELITPIHYGRYGLPDTDVHMSRFEGRNMGLARGSSKTRATPSTAFEAALKDRGTSRTGVAGGIGCSQEVLGREMPPRCLNPPIGPITASRSAACRLDTPLT